MKDVFSSHTLPEPLSCCPFCEVRYTEEALHLFSQAKNALGGEWRDVCHAYCRNCHRSMLYTFEQRPGALVGLGLLTDCDSEDAAKFLFAPKITLREVLEAYEALEGR